MATTGIKAMERQLNDPLISENEKKTIRDQIAWAKQIRGEKRAIKAKDRAARDTANRIIGMKVF